MIIFLSLACVTGKNSADLLSTPNYINSKNHLLERHADFRYESWQKALQKAKILEQKVKEFVVEPSPESLATVRDSWKEARDSYSFTEVFRFQDGPIDNQKTGVEGFLNAWPLDESFIDYTIDDKYTGIINNSEKYPTLTKELLIDLNEKHGEESISLGYHAIEFLLWGQDLSVDGPGDRSPNDYTSEPSSIRRAEYLSLTTTILVEHLGQVAAQWEPNTNNFRNRFVSSKDSLRGIWVGLIMLTGDEMAGERMAVAFETKDQEDEQSCFADYSLQDLQSNLRGVDATYKQVETLLSQVDPQLAMNIDKQLTATSTSLQKIPLPYDQTILATPNNPQFEEAISNLEKLSQLFEQGAQRTGTPFLLHAESTETSEK